MPVTREDLQAHGVVYTPAEVASAMVARALEPLALATAADVLALRVCDFAIGEGAFLVEVVAQLADRLVACWESEAESGEAHGEARAHAQTIESDEAEARAPGERATWVAEARRRIVAACIVGVDIDARAVAAARAALGASARSLRVADALTLDWAATFPEVFAQGGFDVVVGNPPYIRQERLATAAKDQLRTFASYHGVADLYVYFVELAHRVLRPRGRYCLIVPNKWLTVAYGRGLRAFLAEAGSVEGIVDLSRSPVFATADAFPCIVWGTRHTAASGHTAAAIQASRPGASTPVARALRDDLAEHPRDRWQAEPWHIDAPSERALLDRLEREHPRLDETVRARPSRGVVTGCNRAFVIDRETRDRLLAEEPAASELVRPFVKGRDVRSWEAAPIERWILLVDRGTSLAELPRVRAHLDAFRTALEPRPATWSGGAWAGRKPGSYAWFELQDPVVPLARSRAPRLLYQDIQTAPACCLDASGDLVPDTTVWILPTADRFVLAVLNSALYGWYARRRFPPALNGAVRPKLAYLRGFPLARPSSDLRTRIEGLVERRLAIEPGVRAKDPEARHLARDLDGALATAIGDAYALTTDERRVVALG